MEKTFDEAYANYLSFLAKLDTIQDIAEKNVLFRQLTEQLSDLESRLKKSSIQSEREDSVKDDPEIIYWI
jgi:hypothetical protein